MTNETPPARIISEATHRLYPTLAALFVHLTRDVRPHSYSGRGAYGDECAAVAGDEVGEVAGALAEAAVEAGNVTLADLAAVLNAMGVDGLGRRVVVYWRGVPCPPFVDDEDEDEEDEEES